MASPPPFLHPTGSSSHSYPSDLDSPNASWHFPGPSSKYHQRERSHSYQHSRFQFTYNPQGPVLSTEKRAAHRRRVSSGINVLTPPGSECGRSPLGRFHSYSSSTSALSTNMTIPDPTTPAKSPDLRRYNGLQGSPFSDYFTDDDRDVDHAHAAYTGPISETQELVIRMQKLQAQLMREEEGDSILNIVWRKMSDIENEVHALHSQTRMSPELEDSGLFMDDTIDEAISPALVVMIAHPVEEGKELLERVVQGEAPDVRQHNAAARQWTERGVQTEKQGDEVTPANKQAEHDLAMLEAQRVFANVSNAQDQLRQRYAEFRELNHASAVEIEAKEQELEQLRSENERLRSDLAFDHSELLFLKLQFKALEVEVADLEGSEHVSEIMRTRILKETKNWRTDWQAVEHKFKSRLNDSGMFSKHHGELRSQPPVEQCPPNDDAEWHLETVQKDHGRRVQSITIRRLRSSSPLPADQLQESTYLAESPPIRVPTLQYAGQSTQTTPQAPPAPHTVDQATQTEPASQQPAPNDAGDSDLSSSEDDAGPTIVQPASLPSSTDSPVPQPAQKKTAWQDLWTGLTIIAGFVDEDEEDDRI